MRITDHCFTTSAPVFGFDEDDLDPFYSAAREAMLAPPQAKALPSPPLVGRAPA